MNSVINLAAFREHVRKELIDVLDSVGFPAVAMLKLTVCYLSRYQEERA